MNLKIAHKKWKKKCISKYIYSINEIDEELDDEDEKLINQTTQTFLNDKGQFSSKIGYSQIEDDIDEINSFTITETKDEMDIMTTYFSKLNLFLRIALMKELIPLYSFAKQIMLTNHRKTIRMVLLWIFTILNIVLVAFDLYRSVTNPNVYFIIATAFRILLVPLFSYFHIIIHFFVRAKDKTLRIIHHIAFVFTIVIIVVILACFAMKNYYKKNYRIHDFQYKPINESLQYYNQILLSHPVCLFNQFDINSMDAYSYAVAVYDVTDNPKVFDEQMKSFFGENYTSFINVDVENISDEVPFVIYTNKLINTTIVAFRSFNSGPEIAIMLQEVAEYYIVPFFSDLIPFMETIKSFFLDFPIKIAHEFGRMMFDPTNLIKDYVEIVEDICIKKGIDQLDRVLFTGIGTGAILGKIASINFKKYSISFLTLPLWNDYFTNIFNLDDNDMNYVTNVYIYDSFFSKPEPDLATNIGIYPTPFDNGISEYLCNTDLCGINFKGETNYPTFCLIAGMCGYNAKYDHFCKSALPYKNDLDEINDFVKNLTK